MKTGFAFFLVGCATAATGAYATWIGDYSASALFANCTALAALFAVRKLP